MEQKIIYYLLFINIITFILYALDKWKAKKAKQRISERALLTFSFLGGSPAALLAIYSLRHKSSKRSFLIKFYTVIAFQAMLAYLYFNKLA